MTRPTAQVIGDLVEAFTELPDRGPEADVLTLTEKRGFVRQADRFHKRLATDDTSKYRVVRLGDIAFNPYLLWAGALAQNTICEAGIISPLYPTFRVRRGYHPRYVGRLLQLPEMIARYDGIAFGSVPRRRRSSTKDFLALRVPPVPPLAEQVRIATVLDKADELQAKRRAAITHLDSLTQAIFLDMFGDPVSNPRSWPVSRLGDAGTVTTGNTPSRTKTEFFGSQIEWVKSDNLDPRSGTVTIATERLSPAGGKVARMAPTGSILVTCIAGSPNSIGNAALVDRFVAFNQQINAFLPHDGRSLYWLGAISVGKRLIQRASTGAMKGLVNKSKFAAISFPVPPDELRIEFEKRSLTVRRLRGGLLSASEQTAALAASLQARAFRGEL